MRRRLVGLLPTLGNALIAVIVVVAVVLRLYSYTFEGNITGFFQLGALRPLSPYLLDQPVLRRSEQGYDGQFFLSLALDPWLQDEGTIAALDSPRYRYRRILYPLISHILGGGNPHFIPYALVGINVLAIVLIVVVMSRRFQQGGLDGPRSLLVLLLPGIWTTLTLSTADLLASALVVVGFYCYGIRKPVAVAVALSLACLTRETMLVDWVALAITSGLRRQWDQLKLLLGGLVLPILWNGYVILRLPGVWVEGTGNFAVPLAGVFQKVVLLHEQGLLISNVGEVLSFTVLGLVPVVTLIVMKQRYTANQIFWVGTWVYLPVMLSASMAILAFAESYNRVFLSVYLFMLMSGYNRPAWAEMWIMPLAGLVCLKMAIDLLV